jgi:hypothetical protein
MEHQKLDQNLKSTKVFNLCDIYGLLFYDFSTPKPQGGKPCRVGEVYVHNPWLTYGLGIHRLREAGLGFDVMATLDESLLSLGEIYQFCKDFLS